MVNWHKGKSETEEKLKLAQYDILEGMKKSVFERYGLSGMLMQCFEGSRTEALKAAYPELFQTS